MMMMMMLKREDMFCGPAGQKAPFIPTAGFTLHGLPCPTWTPANNWKSSEAPEMPRWTSGTHWESIDFL